MFLVGLGSTQLPSNAGSEVGSPRLHTPLPPPPPGTLGLGTDITPLPCL